MSGMAHVSLRILLIAGSTLALTSMGSAQAAIDSPVGTTVTAPEQLRRADPPPADATPDSLEMKADALRMHKAYADALDYYRAAIAKRPSAVLYNKAGIAELQMLKYDEAQRLFERAVRIDHNYAEAYNNLGVSHYIRRRYKQAVRQYSKALKLSPENANFHGNLGTAHFARKDFDKATAEYMTAMRLDPEIFERNSINGVAARMASPEDRARYHYIIAKMYAGQGDTERGLLYLRKSAEEGFPAFKSALNEDEFAVLRKDPRFTALLESKNVGFPQ